MRICIAFINGSDYNPFRTEKTEKENAVRFCKLRDWIIGKAGIKKRLRTIFLWYLLSLMVETRKHSMTFASSLSGLGKAQFSKFLRNSRGITAHTLETLSKKQAKIMAKVLKKIAGLPWTAVIIIDRILLKSWAIPPASVPIASIL